MSRQFVLTSVALLALSTVGACAQELAYNQSTDDTATDITSASDTSQDTTPDSQPDAPPNDSGPTPDAVLDSAPSYVPPPPPTKQPPGPIEVPTSFGACSGSGCAAVPGTSWVVDVMSGPTEPTFDRPHHRAVAVDPVSGDIICTGGTGFSGIDFGDGHVLWPGGVGNMYLARYSGAGELRWVRLFERDLQFIHNPDEGLAVAVGPDGSIVVSGRFYKRLPLGGGVTLVAAENSVFGTAFLATFDPHGTALWARSFDDFSGHELSLQVGQGTGVAVDEQGRIFMVGHFDGTMDFDDVHVTDRSFLASFEPDGTLIWARGLGKEPRALAIALGVHGRIHVTGGLFGFAQKFFVASYDNEGRLLWVSKACDGCQNAGGSGVSSDLAGNVTIVGYADYDDADFGGGVIGDGGRWTYIVSYDADGAHRWSRWFGHSRRPALALSADERWVMTGKEELLAFDSDGKQVWTVPIAPGSATALAAAPAGGVAVVGSHYGQGFVAKIAP